MNNMFLSKNHGQYALGINHEQYGQKCLKQCLWKFGELFISIGVG